MHDDQQVARLFLYDRSLKAGQFPPRWVDELGFSFGYPLFNFYPPLVYSVGELLHTVGFGFIESTKLVFFLSIFLSGISMFVLAKKQYGNLAGIVGAVFYMYVPYRALDVYVRGALAESFALVWPPLIILAALRLFQRANTNNAMVLAVVLSGLMLTHNLIFLPLLLVLLPAYIFFLVSSDYKKKYIWYSSFAAILCGLLTSFFWLPALGEKKFTIVDDLLIINLADYSKHFVYPRQLWNWTWGFGGSTQGLLDGISFKIGKLHVIVATTSFVFSILLLAKLKIMTKSRSLKIKIVYLYFVLFVFSAFMTTQHSQIIWLIFKPLAYLQFPWRFLTFTALFSSILAAALIYSLKVPILKLVASIILLFILIVPNQKLFRPQFYREMATDTNMTSKEIINWDVSQSSFEYSPKGIELIKNKLGANSVNITKDEIPPSKLSVVTGRAQVSIIDNKPHRIKFIVNAIDDTIITANVFDFPGWKLTIDGEETNYSSNNKFKLITFNLKKGKHIGELQFNNTPLRNLANTISTISFLLLLVYLIKQWLKLRQK